VEDKNRNIVEEDYWRYSARADIRRLLILRRIQLWLYMTTS